MALIQCPECGKEVSDNAGSCPNCGYAFKKKKFCKFCGEEIPTDSVVCTKCGRQVEKVESKDGNIVINNTSSSSSSASSSTTTPTYKKRIKKTTALLLCIFLGWAGGHKFYEGKPVMGIVYLCTFGLFGIGWIVDIIRIAMKPNPYYV